MRDLSGFDTDEAAFAKKPKPIGWFAAGLIGILSIGFVAAYHLPLREAHSTLLEKHELLAKKSNELDQALKAKSKTLTTTTQRKDELEGFLKKGKDAETKATSQLEMAQATVENQLKAYINAKLTHLEIAHEELSIGFTERAVFSGERVVPQVQRQICNAVESVAKSSDLQVIAETPVSDEEKDGWELSGKRAAAIASVLTGRCSVNPVRVKAQAAVVPADKTGDALILRLGLVTSPLLKASEAPEDSVTTN